MSAPHRAPGALLLAAATVLLVSILNLAHASPVTPPRRAPKDILMTNPVSRQDARPPCDMTNLGTPDSCYCPAFTMSCPSGQVSVDSQYINAIMNTQNSAAARAMVAATALIDPTALKIVGTPALYGDMNGLGVLNFAGSCHELASSTYNFSRSIVLTTGHYAALQGYENGPNVPDTTGSSRIPFVDSSVPGSSDCSALEFQVSLKGNDTAQTSMIYAFMSKEYPEFVSTAYNDKFHFVINDMATSDPPVNVARLEQVDEVSVNTVNFNSYSALFQLCQPATFFDGSTIPLQTDSYTFEPGHVYNVKLEICDMSDTQYDSAVVLRAGGFTICTPGTTVMNCPISATVCPNADVPPVSAQDGCGFVATERTDTAGSSVGVSGTYTIGYQAVDGSASCTFDLTVQNSEPRIANTIVLAANNAINTATNPIYTGDTFTVKFDVFEDCCAAGNQGSIDWKDGTSAATFSFGEKTSIVMTHSYAGTVSPQITITLTDCYGVQSTFSLNIYTVCGGMTCISGLQLDTNTCECYKSCGQDYDCVIDTVCSGVCQSNGRCASTSFCTNGCCKATPGNIPGTVDNAICSNGCGKGSCCIESSANSCNSITASDMIGTCTVMYGKEPSCSTDADCTRSGSCLSVKVGSTSTKMCSAQCDDAHPCNTGFACTKFSTTPLLKFCVPDVFFTN